MVNDISDLTDVFNDICDSYKEADAYVVDFDAWSTEDLLELVSIVDQALHLRASEGEEIPGRVYGDEFQKGIAD